MSSDFPERGKVLVDINQIKYYNARQVCLVVSMVDGVVDRWSEARGPVTTRRAAAAECCVTRHTARGSEVLAPAPLPPHTAILAYRLLTNRASNTHEPNYL